MALYAMAGLERAGPLASQAAEDKGVGAPLYGRYSVIPGGPPVCDLNRWEGNDYRIGGQGATFSRLGRLRCAPFHTVFLAGSSEGHPCLPQRAAAAQFLLAGMSVETEVISISSLRGSDEDVPGKAIQLMCWMR